ncbi:hypothetical protein RRG08_052500 [Elysia crispata]|uniref:Uncharacterized protein n=1 Tax=Elysia crispata TaxID=231223 RepID=A0AAE0XP00_9GAST|nr:hypothetical protein RRG08_052500 [Elysia crispata]
MMPQNRHLSQFCSDLDLYEVLVDFAWKFPNFCKSLGRHCLDEFVKICVNSSTKLICEASVGKLVRQTVSSDCEYLKDVTVNSTRSTKLIWWHPLARKGQFFELIETLNSAPSLPQGIRSILGEVGTGSKLVAQGSVTERRFY